MRRSAQKLAVVCVTGWMVALVVGRPMAMQAPVPAVARPAAPAPPAQVGGLTPPADYVIGPEDILSIVFWKDADMTADVVVRPDGKITLPLLNDVQAAGLTPEQLTSKVTQAAGKYFEGHTVMVRVKEIKSRLVTVVGEVVKQGPVLIGGPMTVLQLLSLAGGVTDFADRKNITIIRNENGRVVTFKFNYSDVLRGKNLRQNIELKPGDTVAVP